MPSPLGEGQTDMPINRHYLGEVPPLLPSQLRLSSFCFHKKLPQKTYLMIKTNILRGAYTILAII